MDKLYIKYELCLNKAAKSHYKNTPEEIEEEKWQIQNKSSGTSSEEEKYSIWNKKIHRTLQKISKLKGTTMETIKMKQREEKTEKKKQGISDLWDNTKLSNIHVIGSKRERMGKLIEKWLNFLKFQQKL